MLDRRLGNVHRRIFISHGKDFHALLFTVDLQLFNGCRTVHIAGDQKRFFALLLELSCQLGGGRRLTCSLKTRHHDDCDLLAGAKRDLRRLGTHECGHLLIYDLDDHLSRVQAVHHVGADCPLLHGFRELLNDFKIYICLQKRHLDFL